MRFRSFILLFPAFLAPVFLFAQVSFSTITDELSVHLNGILQVQFIVENASKIEQFQPPEFSDFKVLQGPMETSGMSLVNAQLTQYKALTYVLQPLRKGRLTIPGATALINGKKMHSNRVVVEVGDADHSPSNPYPRNPGIADLQESAEEDFLLGENENANEKIKNNLFVKLDLDKTAAFIGEPIVATYKLYTRLRSESRVSKRPSMNGFSVYDMLEPEGTAPSVEKLNGKAYMVHIIRKTQLFPLQEGDITLEPVELENTVRFLRTGDKARGPAAKSSIEKMFEDLMAEPSGEWEDHRVTLSSEPKKISIKALPPGAPVSFNGAVGKFTIHGKLNEPQVEAGENATYVLTVEGSGNLPLINAPAWQLPEKIEQFDPVITEDINKLVAPMHGSKTFTYTFTASEAADYDLPPIEFSYFDPITKTYKTIGTDPQKLKVTPGNNRKHNTPPPSGQTIKKGSSNKLLWPVFILLSVMAAVILWILFRNMRNQTKPTPVNIEMPQIPVRKDPLAAAKAAAEKEDSSTFYKAVDLALWAVTAEKLRLPGSAQQKPAALLGLAKMGLSTDDLRQLEQCWNECEWALYVPAIENRVNESLLQKAEDLIMSIEALS
ncbi:BatD family protein [Flavihumibacter profundi]|uniref:BatD family protein n=1 Tax=Flavihumibacter profundi TaxID=2716883 RepID=UPI001CC65F96|nr:BatD family protein [Flavihumibacter profundi]MBZ5857901.1 BatD family protein [Flavihumibacter profundi]